MKNQAKSRIKRKLCIQHRKERYEHWLDRLMKGEEVSPEEVTERWQKLQEVRNK